MMPQKWRSVSAVVITVQCLPSEPQTDKIQNVLSSYSVFLNSDQSCRHIVMSLNILYNFMFYSVSLAVVISENDLQFLSENGFSHYFYYYF